MARWLTIAAVIAVFALGAGLRRDWFPEAAVTGVAGDAGVYFLLSAHWQRDGVYSTDGRAPAWERLPGLPALWIASGTHPARCLLPDGALDIPQVRVWLRRAAIVNVVVDWLCIGATMLLALALGARRGALLAGLAWAVQPWSMMVAGRLLSEPLAILLGTLALAALVHATRAERPLPLLAIGGVLVALAQYVRPDSVLCVPAMVLAALSATRGEAWRRHVRALVITLGAWALAFSPWPLRNLVSLGEAHPLGAGQNIDNFGHAVDHRGVYRWFSAWSSDEATSLLAYKIPGAPVWTTMLPPEAFDTPDERRDVTAILHDYLERRNRLDADLTERFARLADARRRRHPVEANLVQPLMRIARIAMPPRDGYGLYTMSAIDSNRAAWTICDGALTIAGFLGAIFLLLRRNTRRIALIPLSAIGLRVIMIGWLSIPDARFFLQALPVLWICAIVAVQQLILLRRNKTISGSPTAER